MGNDVLPKLHEKLESLKLQLEYEGLARDPTNADKCKALLSSTVPICMILKALGGPKRIQCTVYKCIDKHSKKSINDSCGSQPSRTTGMKPLKRNTKSSMISLLITEGACDFLEEMLNRSYINTKQNAIRFPRHKRNNSR